MLTFTLGIKVGAALAATHRETGERILESLLEAEEFQHALRHRRVKPDAALIGADRVVELHAVAAVDLHVALVVEPRPRDGPQVVGPRRQVDDPVPLAAPRRRQLHGAGPRLLHMVGVVQLSAQLRIRERERAVDVEVEQAQEVRARSGGGFGPCGIKARAT